MPVPTLISELSQTPGSNFPLGSESPSVVDDYFRTYAAFIAQHRDGKGYTAEASLASGATTDIGAQNSFFVQITGTTTITSFGTNYNGPRYVRFAGALTLTHNATTLILPGGANITTAAGDRAILTPIGAPGSGWQVLAYERASFATAFADIKQAATDTATGVAELATNAEAQTGTDTARAVTPANLGATVLGMGQTYQDVKASRSVAVTYTNTTGRTILVAASIVSTTNSALGMEIDGVQQASTLITAGNSNLISLPIPPGATYRVTNSAGTPTVNIWQELR